MKYELFVIIPAKYSETELPGIFDGITDAIKSAGAEVSSREDMGKQKLAYPIGGNHFGHLLLIKMEAASEIAKKLNEQLRLRPDIIRHMLTRVIERKPLTPHRQSALLKKDERVMEPIFAAVGAVKAEEKKDLSCGALAKEEEKVTLEDLDKKLEEILGKETI